MVARSCRTTYRRHEQPHLFKAEMVLADASCSGQHAALVHHQDARIFLIDLQSVRFGLCKLHHLYVTTPTA